MIQVKTGEHSELAFSVSTITIVLTIHPSALLTVNFAAFLANTGGIVSGNVFLDKYEPAYRVPLGITLAIEVTGLTLILFLRFWMTWDNRKRNRSQGVNWQSKDVPTEALTEGPKNPLFRHFC